MSNMKKLALAAGSFYLLICAAFAPYALRAPKHDPSPQQDLQTAARSADDAAGKAESATQSETKNVVRKSAKKLKHDAAEIERKTQPGK